MIAIARNTHFNLSHSSSIVIAGYLLYVCERAGYPVALAIVGGIFGVLVWAYLVGALLIYPVVLKARDRGVLLAAGLGVSTVVSGGLKLAFGPESLRPPVMYDSNSFRLFASLGLLLMFAVLHTSAKRSHTGRSIEAISHDWPLAEITTVRL